MKMENGRNIGNLISELSKEEKERGIAAAEALIFSQDSTEQSRQSGKQGDNRRDIERCSRAIADGIKTVE